ncbi:CRISPR-associated protein Csx15, partial [Anaerolinea sp.]|uniref:CRISPR-associated protein Csx15 n=1 Tax=Anaerolinea sp. TaxID=1872519 RepID=UPI002ACD617E
PQVTAMVDQAGLTLEEWQNAPIIVNPPSLNFSAVLLIAELHGRMGYFPACVRLRPVNGAIPPRFEVAEVLNLQLQRNAARRRRA